MKRERADPWKTHLLTLPDSLFFNFIRNYLGEVPTPFNKHDLIEELTRFINRRETQARMYVLLSSQEKKILSGIKALGKPTLDMLFLLLAQEIGYLELNQKLQNLESRLLIFRSQEGGEERFTLNPHLSKSFCDKACGLEHLIRLHRTKSRRLPGPWLQDSLCLAFLSFLADGPALFKAAGDWRMKAREEVVKVFPVLDEKGGSRLELLVKTLRRLCLVRQVDQRLAPDLRIWESFCGIDGRIRSMLTWSAAVLPDWFRLDGGEAPWGDAGRRGVLLLADFLGSVPPDHAVSREEAERIYMILSVSHGLPFPTKQDLVNVVNGLVALQLLAASRGDNLLATRHGMPEKARVRKIIVQPNFEVSIPQELDLALGLPLAIAARIIRFDQMAVFEITRSSFYRYLNQGRKASELARILEDLSERALPQNVLFSIEAWDKEYRKLQIYDGIVLVADKDREYLLEHSRLLKSYIYKKLAPGIYLLGRDEMGSWQTALSRAGLEYVPEVETAERKAEEEASGKPFADGSEIVVKGLRLTVGDGETRGTREATLGREADDTREAEPLLRDLRRALERKKARLGEWDADEIRRRIDERLILFSRQLVPLRKTSEKAEAKGLDYAGKVRVIERAIYENGLLEILERMGSGTPRRLSVEPQRLEKKGSDLLLHGVRIPERRDVAVRMSKIGVVRRIRKNLR